MIKSIQTINKTYWVYPGFDSDEYFDSIEMREKAGAMSVSTIWYFCFRKGKLVKEINAAHVVEVEHGDD